MLMRGMLAHRLPAIGFVECARAGCMLAYGVDFPDLWHNAAAFVDRILESADPPELPVEQAAKFELVVNRATARALGVPIPRPILVRASETLE
jgi:putative ABC transport system substrate-binding protein